MGKMKRPRTTRPAKESRGEEGKFKRKPDTEGDFRDRRGPRPFDKNRSDRKEDTPDRRPARPFDKKRSNREGDAPERRPARSYDKSKSNREGDAPERRPARSFDKNKSSREGDTSERRPSRSFDKNKSNREGDAPERRSARPFEKQGDRRRPGKFEGKEGERSGTGRFDRTKERDERGSGRPGRFNRSDKPGREESSRGGRSSQRRSEERPWNRKEKHEFYGDKKRGSYSKGKSSVPKTTAADEGLVRLNKYIANAGICSRREADEMITAGVVSVNGEIVTTLGYKVKPDDVVKYNNEVLSGERNVYVLLNKPKDFITTTDDPDERKTVMSLVAKACKERIYPVGRLDRNTTGVLLFTNDGDLARKLTHPKFEIEKVYQVELDKGLKATDLTQIREGLKLDDGFVKVDEVVYAGPEKNLIGVELHSGKNRIVRRIFEHLGYSVKKLDRVVFAGLTKKDLPRGRWRFLTDMEVANLKMITGNKKFAGN